MSLVEGMERAVAELCSEVGPAGLEPPAPEVRLTDLGFDSLACADLAIAMEERFGVRLADADVTGLVTVGDVARAAGAPRNPRARPPRDLGSFQPAAKALGGWFFRAWCRPSFRGVEHIPLSGPAVVAANHRSFFDIPLMAMGTRRTVKFMAKQELFAGPIRRWFIGIMGGFEVQRGAPDLRAIDRALAVLDGGGLVGMYPEGTRSRTGELQPFYGGVAWLALHTGAPVVPCGIAGIAGRDHVRRSRIPDPVTVAFGPPITTPREPDPRARRAMVDALTRRVRTAVSDLLG